MAVACARLSETSASRDGSGRQRLKSEHARNGSLAVSEHVLVEPGHLALHLVD
jgi:hypothetical protein